MSVDGNEQGRPPLPPGTIVEPLDGSIDPDSFTPRLLALLSNALVWRESHELRRRFQLGTNEWRVISALASRPGATATEISEFLVVNKAIVSKSVNALVQRGMLVLSDGPRGSRPMYLSADGADMHDQMLPVSMRGQELILSHVTHDDVEQFNLLLHRMLEELRDLQIVERTLAQSAAHDHEA